MLDTNLLHTLEVLPIQERMAIMEYLARSVQKDLQPKPRRKAKPKSETPQRIEFSRGMLRRAGVPPLTDEEVEEVLANYPSSGTMSPIRAVSPAAFVQELA